MYSDSVLIPEILPSVKKALGLPVDATPFDAELMMDINAVFSTLYQLGVGPDEPYMIDGPDNTWSEFYTIAELSNVRTYVYLRVRLLFDPPANSFVVSSFEKQIEELEWRMNVTCDPGSVDEVNDGE